jgi:predicted ATPase
MKLREVRAQNIRNFGPDALPVSFVDEATGQVRALTVLVGSNGSGKTTLLELIHGACLFAVRGKSHFRKSAEGGAPSLQTFSSSMARRDATFSILLHIQASETESEVRLDFQGPRGFIRHFSDALRWADYVFSASQAMTAGGILSFPANRFLPEPGKAAISRPEESHAWLYRYIPSDKWEGSLEQLWVWQNYLDLEAQQAGRPSLLPFVATIEEILGRGQTIKIKAGEVWIERPQSGDRVRPHELPSGEQQVLLIFGEILRRLRPGAIVMIDELEMNLHPGLQRVVIHHLRRLAQKHDLQIIVTTHSMEIVAACDPSEIVNLDAMVFAEQTRTATESQ